MISGLRRFVRSRWHLVVGVAGLSAVPLAVWVAVVERSVGLVALLALQAVGLVGLAVLGVRALTIYRRVRYVELQLSRLATTARVTPATRGTSATGGTSATPVTPAAPPAKKVAAKRPVRLPSDITAGTVLGGIGSERLPVVLLLLVGTPVERIGDVAEEVASVQVLGAGFRPVFVIDSPVFAPIRRFGYVVELVVARNSWSADGSWSEYLRRRVASMMDLYSARAVITVGADGLGDGGRAALEAFG